MNVRTFSITILAALLLTLASSAWAECASSERKQT
jgi:hypothetical protein